MGALVDASEWKRKRAAAGLYALAAQNMSDAWTELGEAWLKCVETSRLNAFDRLDVAWRQYEALCPNFEQMRQRWAKAEPLLLLVWNCLGRIEVRPQFKHGGQVTEVFGNSQRVEEPWRARRQLIVDALALLRAWHAHLDTVAGTPTRAAGLPAGGLPETPPVAGLRECREAMAGSVAIYMDRHAGPSSRWENTPVVRTFFEVPDLRKIWDALNRELLAHSG
jgi:hypothetical protein